ncbi:MAG: YIP1 family protein, partial [Proteobacteria bacterium]|nr:YIP1 family protein [Pseudomonadota bacterium]
MVLSTLKDPREGASNILAFAPTRQMLWFSMIVVVIISILMSEIANYMLPVVPDNTIIVVMDIPLLAAGILMFIMVVMIYCTHYIGQACGGNGRLDESFSVVIWLQSIMISLQLLQLLIIPFFPNLAVVFGLFGGVVFFWLYINFVTVLHGFNSLGKVTVGVIFSIVGVF